MCKLDANAVPFIKGTRAPRILASKEGEGISEDPEDANGGTPGQWASGPCLNFAAWLTFKVKNMSCVSLPGLPCGPLILGLLVAGVLLLLLSLSVALHRHCKLSPLSALFSVGCVPGTLCSLRKQSNWESAENLS